jgi:hypothetical protein
MISFASIVFRITVRPFTANDSIPPPVFCCPRTGNTSRTRRKGIATTHVFFIVGAPGVGDIVYSGKIFFRSPGETSTPLT